jgi:hypothetical protein
MARRSQEEPYLVTTAPQAPRDELAARQRRYLWTMGIRVVFFILAIILFEVIPGARALRFAVAAVAMILPWVAVVAANAGPQRKRGRPSTFAPTPPKAIGKGSDR